MLDAIDSVANKSRLIALCREKEIPIVTCGGAGGRRDPTAIRLADLILASHDRLLQQVRAQLRKAHGFPRGEQRWGVQAVYSTERQLFPQPDGTVCATRAANAQGESLRLNCESGFGTATFVTGAFGFAAAGEVVRQLTQDSERTLATG